MVRVLFPLVVAVVVKEILLEVNDKNLKNKFIAVSIPQWRNIYMFNYICMCMVDLMFIYIISYWPLDPKVRGPPWHFFHIFIIFKKNKVVKNCLTSLIAMLKIWVMSHPQGVPPTLNRGWDVNVSGQHVKYGGEGPFWRFITIFFPPPFWHYSICTFLGLILYTIWFQNFG